tara:strand:- start:248 stop:499 length:252 start_codon:yes stop_codon:yes gene_type:complete
MEPLMKTVRRLFALGTLLTVAGCSTPAICDQACQAWEDTCGYSDYTYSQCTAECFADQDWSQAYADCVTVASTCSEIELICDA